VNNGPLSIYTQGALNFRGKESSDCTWLNAMALACHPEPFADAQGKLRDGSGSMGVEMLRYAQHDSTVLPPRYLRLITRNARPPGAERVLLHKLR
jgi:hypothetical protein